MEVGNMSKIRVHELAKELNKNSKDIINFFAEKNIEIKSHMSSLEEELVELYKNSLIENKK